LGFLLPIDHVLGLSHIL